MKIVLAADTYAPSVNGAAYFTQRLAQALAKAGHQVSVLAPSTTALTHIFMVDKVTIYAIGSIPIPIYPNFRIAPFFLVRRKIRKILSELQPDVVHVQSHFIIGKEVIMAARRQHIPIVGTNHFMPDNLIHYFPAAHIFGKYLKAFGWWQLRRVYKHAALLTTPTHTAAAILHRVGIHQPVEAISCGIDCVRFQPGLPDTTIKKKYNIPDNCPVILYVGRLDQEKKVDVIIRSLPLMLKKKKVHLVVAGVGKERLALESLVHSLGIEKQVSFTGFVPDTDLPEIYRTADVFVMASEVELQSIATLEAMASGLPIVAVAALALPELVQESHNGYLFPAGDTETLANRVVAILSDESLRQRMKQHSLEIIKKHDIHRVTATFEALYQRVLK